MTSLSHKKTIKRTGDAVIFNDQGKLTEDAIHTCKICGVDPRELYPKTLEHFLKGGIRHSDAQLQFDEYEKKRQLQVKYVVKNITEKTARAARKVNNHLQTLSMPHEERILRTTYKSGGKSEMLLQSRQPYQCMSATMRLDYSPGSTNGNEQHDLLLRQDKNRQRWLSVLRTKEHNIEMHLKNTKDQLAKGFKREREAKNLLKTQNYIHLDKLERNAERREKVALNKKTDDIRALKNRREEESRYKKKMEQSELRRRQQMLNRNGRNEQTFMSASIDEAPKTSMDGKLNQNKSNQDVTQQDALNGGQSYQQILYSTHGNRARSSTNRKLELFDENLAIQKQLYEQDEKQRKAMDIRIKETGNRMQRVQALTSKIDEHLIKKAELDETRFMTQFEQNVKKRQQIEKRKKEASLVMNEILMNTKMEREMHETQLRERLKNTNQQEKKKISKQLKQWEEDRRAMEKKQPPQIQLDRLQILKDTNQDRLLNHKVNLARCKRKQQEYKAVLIDNLCRKEQRAQVINDKRTTAIHIGMAHAKNMQDAIMKTTQSTFNSIQPVPFEVHQREFKANKANKPEQVNLED